MNSGVSFNRSLAYILRAATVAAAALMLSTTLQADPDRHDSPHHKGGRNAHDHDRRFDSYRSSIRVGVHISPGHRVQRLPDRYQNLRVGNQRYYYSRGIFYRPAGGGYYTVVRAPLGARVAHVPTGYLSFSIGTRHYLYGNFTYFLWDRAAAEYIVVEEPPGAESAVVAASKSAPEELFIYPNRGQSDEQRDFDRYQCYLWASDQTGYDPGGEASQNGDSSDYRRAMSACLEGRGYTVK